MDLRGDGGAQETLTSLEQGLDGYRTVENQLNTVLQNGENHRFQESEIYPCGILTSHSPS